MTKIIQFLKIWESQNHDLLATLEWRDIHSLYHPESESIIIFGKLPPNERARISEQCAFLIEIDEEIDELLTNNILDNLLDNEGVIYKSDFC